MKRKLIAKPSRREIAFQIFRDGLFLLQRAQGYEEMADHFCSGPEHAEHRVLVRTSVRSRLNSFATSVSREVGMIFGKESREFQESSRLQQALNQAFVSVNEVMAQVGQRQAEFLDEWREAGGVDLPADAFLEDSRYLVLRPALAERLLNFRLVLIDFVVFHQQLQLPSS